MDAGAIVQLVGTGATLCAAVTAAILAREAKVHAAETDKKMAQLHLTIHKEVSDKINEHCDRCSKSLLAFQQGET